MIMGNQDERVRRHLSVQEEHKNNATNGSAIFMNFFIAITPHRPSRFKTCNIIPVNAKKTGAGADNCDGSLFSRRRLQYGEIGPDNRSLMG